MTPTTHQKQSRLSELAMTATVAILIEGMGLALAWIVPFELVPPRVG
jgi:hypothetical protein